MCAATSATTIQSNTVNNKGIDNMIGTVSLLVPSSEQSISKYGAKSPIDSPSYIDVAKQLVRKINQFSDGRIVANVVTPESNNDGAACIDCDALLALGLSSPSDIQYLSRTFRQRREKNSITPSSSTTTCQFAIDCGDNNYAPIVGPYDEANPSILQSFPWTDVASGKRLAVQMNELFNKHSTDEFALAVMLFFNRFISPVPWVQHSIDTSWEKGFKNIYEIYQMISKCGPCITKCLSDDNCRSCIMALDEIDTRDQVNSYRTVVSFESELLRDFSLCILQKNNIFECYAEIPKLPVVKPLSEWRGEEVTLDVARGIMIGHLEGVDDCLEVRTQHCSVS